MSTVSLQIRQVTVNEAAELTALDGDDVFVATDDPPPVRTIVACREGDGGEVQALEVVRVVEVPESDERGTRGFYARTTHAQALGAHWVVGTENFSGGHGPPPGLSSSSLGAPAPVMDPDDSMPIDNRERAVLEADAEADDADGQAADVPAYPPDMIQTDPETGAAAPTPAQTPTDDDASPSESGRRKRKRRGRKSR
jgi:hypothetical protein